MGKLTTHVLDQSKGRPAAGLAIRLCRIAADGAPEPLAAATTNDDGRLDQPILAGGSFQEGSYQLEFEAGAYFKANGTALACGSFLDTVVIRFHVADAEDHYHVPLLLSPYGYATYRGS